MGFKYLFYYLAICILLMSVFSFFGCLKKTKAGPEDVSEWLQMQWPDRFEVVATITNFTDKEYYLGKRRSVVAVKADKNVQFILPWVTKAVDFGIIPEEVEKAYESSLTEISRARELQMKLKNAGLQKFSVGHDERYAFIMVFDEPSPETRAQKLSVISTVLSEDPSTRRAVLYFIEPDRYGDAFQDIIPAGHWVRRDSWQNSNEIMSLIIPDDIDDNHRAKQGKWQCNIQASRSETYIDNAYAAAVAWSKKNVPANYTVGRDSMVEIGLSKQDGLLLEINFPYFEIGAEVPANEIRGKVCGVYSFDDQTFQRIHIVKNASE